MKATLLMVFHNQLSLPLASQSADSYYSFQTSGWAISWKGDAVYRNPVFHSDLTGHPFPYIESYTPLIKETLFVPSRIDKSMPKSETDFIKSNASFA